jgi:hypothetical protein
VNSRILLRGGLAADGIGTTVRRADVLIEGPVVAAVPAHYLRAGPWTGYQDLARHLPTHAADAYGLRDRGRVAAGMAADPCVIGAGGPAAHATYDRPRELATGVEHVFVHGVPIWAGGRSAPGRRPGKLISASDRGADVRAEGLDAAPGAAAGLRPAPGVVWAGPGAVALRSWRTGG